MKISFTLPIAAPAYNNEAAHQEVLAMMKRGERLAMFFAIDKYGCEIVRVESHTTERFSYQLNEEALNWLLAYLIKGETEDGAVDPTKPNKADGMDSDSFRKAMLMEFVKAKLGNLQLLPGFLDRPGRLTATASFNNGAIKFFTQRDEEIEGFLRENKLVG